MSQVFAFFDGEWRRVQSVSAYHEGIGFVKLNSVKVFDGTDWLIVDFDGQGARLVRRQELVQI